MMAFPPKKKGAAPPAEDDFEMLMGAEESAEDSLEDDELPTDDELEAAGDDAGDFDALEDTGVDPEVAVLCERLGFDEPDQQMALVDLIKRVMEPAAPMDDPMALGGDMMGAPPPGGPLGSY